MLNLNQALIYTFAMAAVIFLCRALPFILFRERDGENEGNKGDAVPSRRRRAFTAFVEQTVPQAAMTVLACSAIAGPIKENLAAAPPVLAASAFTALVHLWKRNPLVSIFGGTALYMILSRLGG